MSLNGVAQEKPMWVKSLDSLHFEKDYNKKIFQLKQIAVEIKKMWTTMSASEIVNLSNKLFSAESEDGKFGIIVFAEQTYGSTMQIEWLVKENLTGEETIWLFEDEVHVKNVKSSPQLMIDIVYNNIDDLYGVSISNNNGLKLIESVDLLTKCWFEKLFLQVTNSQKDSVNAILKDRLSKLWVKPSLFESELTGLNRMKTILSKDGNVKICTYNVEKEGFKHEFYGAVISKSSGLVQVYPLNDSSEEIRSPERSTLNNKKWYGAIYLDVIETSVKDKTYYTLIGYKGHDEFIKTRVIDVMLIQNNRIRFGAPIFKEDRLTRHRMIYKYSAGANMMMRYDVKMKMIVLDNLEPTEPFYRGVYRFYGPDFSYNGFKFQKGYWELIEDIDLRNPRLNH